MKAQNLIKGIILKLKSDDYLMRFDSVADSVLELEAVLAMMPTEAAIEAVHAEMHELQEAMHALAPEAVL